MSLIFMATFICVMCRGGEQEFCTVLLRCSSNPPPPVTQFYRVGLMGHAGSTSTGDRTLFGHPVPMFGFHVCCAREQLNRRAPATAHHTLIRQKLTQALLSLQSFRVYSQKSFSPKKNPPTKHTTDCIFLGLLLLLLSSLLSTTSAKPTPIQNYTEFNATITRSAKIPPDFFFSISGLSCTELVAPSGRATLLL